MNPVWQIWYIAYWIHTHQYRLCTGGIYRCGFCSHSVVLDECDNDSTGRGIEQSPDYSAIR